MLALLTHSSLVILYPRLYSSFVVGCILQVTPKIVLFVCLLFGVNRQTREFFTNMETSPLLVKAANFDQCSALMAIEQSGSLACHTYWDTGHPFIMIIILRGPATLKPIPERLEVEISILVFTSEICGGWDSNTQTTACGPNALTHCATDAVQRAITNENMTYGLCYDLAYVMNDSNKCT